MTFEIASIHAIQDGYVQTEVTKVERIDMYAVLVSAGFWLVLEGFVNGYAFTEAGVDRLHVLLQQELAARIN